MIKVATLDVQHGHMDHERYRVGAAGLVQALPQCQGRFALGGSGIRSFDGARGQPEIARSFVSATRSPAACARAAAHWVALRLAEYSPA
jgi:hypothetical protein